jgi:hypothetical protein
MKAEFGSELLLILMEFGEQPSLLGASPYHVFVEDSAGI